MLKFTLQLFSALEHVHMKGYVHCDVVSSIPRSVFLVNTTTEYYVICVEFLETTKHILGQGRNTQAWRLWFCC